VQEVLYRLYSSPVTGLAASFSPVPTKSGLKKCEAYFFKGEKAAAFRLRCPPAVEATALYIKSHGENRRHKSIGKKSPELISGL